MAGGKRRCFDRDNNGAVAALSCILLTVILWCGAFAVDLGSVHREKRMAQAAADLAAMAAAADLVRAEDAARATLAANAIDELDEFQIVTGRYSADALLSPQDRFMEGETPANAARLKISRPAKLHLAAPLLGIDSWTIGAEATAVAIRQAAFSLGSRLARLEGGVPNAMLGDLIGSEIALTVMDYEALLGADVKLFDFLSALEGEAGISAESWEDVVAAEVSMKTVLRALSSAAGEGAAASAIARLADAADVDLIVPLAEIIDLGPLGETAIEDRPSLEDNGDESDLCGGNDRQCGEADFAQPQWRRPRPREPDNRSCDR